MESECDGRVYIPKNLKISVLVAENLYEVAQARQAKLASTGDNNGAKSAALRACATMTLTSEQTIPVEDYANQYMTLVIHPNTSMNIPKQRINDLKFL